MTKSIKSIIALSSALVVLGGGAVCWKVFMDNEPEEVSSSEPSESSGGTELIHKNPDDINKIEITNTSGSFNLLRLKKSEESGDFGKTLYTIEGYEDLLLDTSVLWTLSNNMGEVRSNTIVAEDCTDSDAEKYGFDEPVTAVLHYDSGETVKFYIGDVSPLSENTYFMLDGDNTVYTVSTALISNYRLPKNDFVSKIVLEEPPEDNYPIVNSINIKRDDIDYDILIEYDEKSDDDNYNGGTSAAHIMTQPIFSYLSVERSIKVTNGLFGLTANDFYAVHPDENDIAEAGLKSPFCTVEFKCNDNNNYTLYMSEPFTDDDAMKYHYVMLEGNNIIYKISTESAVWGTVMPVDFASKTVFGSTVWDIEKLTVSGKNSDVITFECEGSSKETLKVQKNNENFDSEHFRLFYSFLIDAPGEEFALDRTVPDKEPSAAVTVTDRYLEKTYTVEFYDDTALRSLIVIDGECRYICSKSYVDTLLENIKRIDTGEEYIRTWK